MSSLRIWAGRLVSMLNFAIERFAPKPDEQHDETAELIIQHLIDDTEKKIPQSNRELIARMRRETLKGLSHLINNPEQFCAYIKLPSGKRMCAFLTRDEAQIIYDRLKMK